MQRIFHLVAKWVIVVGVVLGGAWVAAGAQYPEQVVPGGSAATHSRTARPAKPTSGTMPARSTEATSTATTSGIDAAPLATGLTAGPIYLPYILRSVPPTPTPSPTSDPFATWQDLGQAVPAGAVNYLYLSQDCGGSSMLPTMILAATENGVYRYAGSWQQVGVATVAHIFATHLVNTTAGLFVASYGQGIFKSTDGGNSWSPETIADTQIYWLADSPSYLFAAGAQGLYQYNKTAAGPWTQVQSGGFYAVAVANSHLYAIQIGTPKDLVLTGDVTASGAGNFHTAQLPADVSTLQTIEGAKPPAPELLIGSYQHGLYSLDTPSAAIRNFSTQPQLTAYGIWQDGSGSIYAAFDTGGGVQRYPATGGAPNEDLSGLPNGASLAAQALYTVNGSTTCNIIGVGSQSGHVWLRRLPH